VVRVTNKIGKYIFFVLLLFLLSVGINNKAALSEESSKYPKIGNTDIDKFAAVLPAGWRYKINTSNLDVTMFTEETPKFTLIIDDPSITCVKEIRYKQCATVSPHTALYFYDKWNMSKRAAFDNQVTKLHNLPKSVSAPALFIETDKYTVFTYGGVSCPGKPIQEIENYLKGYFKKYDDLGVNAIVRAIQEDEIKKAVFLYQYEQNPSGLPQDIKVCFLSVGDPVLEKDPTDNFLKRFQGQPIAVKKVSQCKLNGGIEDKETGLKGKICQAKLQSNFAQTRQSTNGGSRAGIISYAIKWINDAQVEVSGGIYFGFMAAGGYIYHVVWKNNEWLVQEAKPAWFS